MDDEQRTGPTEASSRSEAGPGWPPEFPHAAIDALLDRLQRVTTADAAGATELLLLVTDEARRLRSAVVRLSTARLAGAEREAQAIIAEAQEWAAGVRAAALEIVDARLDEADRLMAATRMTVRTQHGRRGTAAECGDGPAPVLDDL